jgi:hypothetical protein
MENDEDDFSYQIEPRSNARRFLPKAVLVCAVMGGIYGAALGSVIGATADATKPIGVAAGVLAVRRQLLFPLNDN